jgi:hypothetical protein
MSALQKKILGIIKAKIVERGFEALDKAQWANTGDIHIGLPGKFGTKAKVDYNFQDDKMSLSIYLTMDGKSIGVPSQPPRQGYFDHYMNYEAEKEFEVFMRHLDETLDKLGSSIAASKPENQLFLVRTLESDDDGDPFYTGVVRAKDIDAAEKFTRETLVLCGGKEFAADLQIRVYPLDDVEEGILPTTDPGFQDFPKRKGKRK